MDRVRAMTGNPRVMRLLAPASADNFDEQGYLRANPDVARAVASGQCPSGRVHFDHFGLVERRLLRLPVPEPMRRHKRARFMPLLREGLPHRDDGLVLDYLDDGLREAFGVVATDNISEHEYDARALALIDRHADGVVLDCGAGQRNVYHDNVVNYEIVAYDSTDIIGVAECLPFRDGSIDAVLSLNVLEHVKDPFTAARELIRVLKPGGELMCVAPFLQPLHGYPHHYYNMTREGLLALFAPLQDSRLEIYGAMQPLWALNWFLASYKAGLPESERERFERLTVADLLRDPRELETDPLVLELSEAARTELASAHALFARKPG